MSTAAPQAVAPERERDAVRMLVAAPGRPLVHAAFRDLPEHLRAGDLLVVNASATLPAALPLADGLRLHLSTPLPPPASRQTPARADAGAARNGEAAPHEGGQIPGWPADGHERWVVELRAGGAPYRGGRAGERLALPGGGRAELLAPYLGGARLWAARLTLPEPLLAYLDRHGEPIRYAHAEPRPLADHQTIIAPEPGSAEMPSAGHPFTPRVLADLRARGVELAEIVLHTGVSSLERGERPYPERFRVPPETRAAAGRARRVIAVGTTVVRALESPGDGGWTRHVVTPETGVSVVDGLLTGWHDADATHLELLEAVAGRELVARSYAAGGAYRRHEFGDVHLLLAR